jgi:nucleoside-diphosphate kinase
MERSLIIIKPDGVCKKNAGEVIKRLEEEQFDIKAVKMFRFTEEKAREFYGVHKEKSFFPGLIKFMITAPCIAVVVEGEDAINRIRKMIGARVPKEAEKGTIRGDFGSDGRRNIVHGSDSKENAGFEIGYLFSPEEIYSYNKEDWLDSEAG